MNNLGGWAGPGLLLWAQWCFPFPSKRGGTAHLLKCTPCLLKCLPCPTPPSQVQPALLGEKPAHLAAGPREPALGTSKVKAWALGVEGGQG